MRGHFQFLGKQAQSDTELPHILRDLPLEACTEPQRENIHFSVFGGNEIISPCQATYLVFCVDHPELSGITNYCTGKSWNQIQGSPRFLDVRVEKMTEQRLASALLLEYRERKFTFFLDHEKRAFTASVERLLLQA